MPPAAISVVRSRRRSAPAPTRRCRRASPAATRATRRRGSAVTSARGGGPPAAASSPEALRRARRDDGPAKVKRGPVVAARRGVRERSLPLRGEAWRVLRGRGISALVPRRRRALGLGSETIPAALDRARSFHAWRRRSSAATGGRGAACLRGSGCRGSARHSPRLPSAESLPAGPLRWLLRLSLHFVGPLPGSTPLGEFAWGRSARAEPLPASSGLSCLGTRRLCRAQACPSRGFGTHRAVSGICSGGTGGIGISRESRPAPSGPERVLPLHHLLNLGCPLRERLRPGGRLAPGEEVVALIATPGQGSGVHGPINRAQALARRYGRHRPANQLSPAQRGLVHGLRIARHAPAHEILRGSLRDGSAHAAITQRLLEVRGVALTPASGAATAIPNVRHVGDVHHVV